MKQQEYKQFFETKKQEILTLAAKKASEQVVDSDVGDDMDVASQITIDDMSYQLFQRNQALLSRINIALRKIDQGVFGDCEECDEEISEARLKAVPDCRLCINCAEREEKIRKQYRS